MRNHFCAALTALCTLTALPVIPAAAEADYPQSFEEYETLLAELQAQGVTYRVDADSVYFVNPSISASEQELIVSAQYNAAVTSSTYGFVFTPEEDGIFYVTGHRTNEELVCLTDAGEDGKHFHYFYQTAENYCVTRADGVLTVEQLGTWTGYSEEQIEKETAEGLTLPTGPEDGEEVVYDLIDYSCYDVQGAEFPWDAYYAYINGQMGEDYPAYVSTIYSQYSAASRFCVTLPYSEVYFYEARVRSSDDSLTLLQAGRKIPSTADANFEVTTEDVKHLYRLKPLADGEVTVSSSETVKALEITNGVFRYPADTARPEIDPVLPGDCNADGALSVADAVMLTRILHGESAWTFAARYDQYAADVNADGEIDIFDLALLKRALLEQEEDITIDGMLADPSLMARAMEPCGFTNVFIEETRALIVVALPMQEVQDGCVISYEPMSHAVFYAVKNAEILAQDESISYDHGYAYCLLQAKEPGSVEVEVMDYRDPVDYWDIYELRADEAKTLEWLSSGATGTVKAS